MQNKDWSNWATITTSVVAIAALLLSLYNFIVSRLDKKAKVRIRLSTGPYKHKGKKSEKVFIVEIVNIGQTTVQITDVYILVGKEDQYIEAVNIEDEEQQAIIQPYQNAIFWAPFDHMKLGKKPNQKIVARAHNALNQSFYSKAIRIEENP